MHRKKAILKATISYIIVALLFVLIPIGTIQAAFGNQISEAISLVNMISNNTKNEDYINNAEINSETKRLQNKPKYGTQYATLQIESLNVNLPLYYGDSLSFLRNGAGQSMGGYFPGEGGSVICMAHNTRGFLYELHNIQLGAIIKITTSYGTFQYKVYDTKVIDQTDMAATPVQDKEEILMLYTCHPTNTIGHATHRFVAYAKLVWEE